MTDTLNTTAYVLFYQLLVGFEWSSCKVVCLGIIKYSNALNFIYLYSKLYK